MLSTIYTGLTGLLGFSKGLDVISSNIANLNTPGFKSSELAFRDLFYRYTEEGSGYRSQVGYGLETKGTRTRFRQGEMRETGNPLDVALQGNGFLVLKREANADQGYGAAGAEPGLFYTRAGQLEFGQDGVLIDRVSGARVMSLQGGTLREMSLAGLRTSAPQATARIQMSGFLSRSSNSAVVENVTIFDGAGGSHTVSIHFNLNTEAPNQFRWFVEVREGTNRLGERQEVRFEPNGAPAAGANTASFTFAPAPGLSSTLTIDLGDPGSFIGVTNPQISGQSDLQVRSQDGFAAGALTSATFSESGALRLAYSNGRTVTGPSLALAWFDDLQALRLSADSLFVNDSGQQPILGTAGADVMGRVVAGRVELSNVELTEQFSDLIILQRGYQASSQITSVANEMIQQLLDIARKR